MAKIACSYCNTLNDTAEKSCIGCGAPLEIPTPKQSYSPQGSSYQVKPAVQPAQATSPFGSGDSQKLQQGAQQVEKLYAGATSALGTAWSIAADAIAISLVAFALGVIGGASGIWYAGLIGAMLVGLVVGFSQQSFWVTIAGAPIGALAGIIVGAIAWAVGAGPRWMVLTTTGLACLGGLLGSRSRMASLGCKDAVRPLLGAAGGFFVALVGMAIGIVIRSL